MILGDNQPSPPQVHVIHEHNDWVVPLREEFADLGVPYAEWFLDRGALDLTGTPPEGVFYNRISASSHTRDHRYAPEFTAAVLAWLSAHGRTVVNGERALQLELSKVAQYEALRAFDIPTPETSAVIVRDNILPAAERMGFPLIVKHNRAGKGLGVRLVHSASALKEHLAGADFEDSIDGINLVQRYIEAPEPFITRVEFVGGKLVYAVVVDTSEGFELCPADACQVDGGAADSPTAAPREMFRILADFDHPLVPAWQTFLAANEIAIAGIEFVVDASGRSFTYDVNTNTNHNPDAEAKDGRRGMRAIAEYLGKLLTEQYGEASALHAAA